tara:strand:- start:412 stop:969 length:558 start_codon:yes stop_codon:yes gene_type:complete
MKFLRFYIIVFISITTSIKADLNENLISQLKEGGKIIFIRHAYAPGSGDPEIFNLNDCSTQRNLNSKGKIQSKKIGEFFKKNNISTRNVYSSEWCRCKETALIAFKKFETKSFLNSFFSEKFVNNREKQMIDLKNFLDKWDQDQNLIFVTHYVVIYEALDYAPASGEIVISDKNYKLIGSISNIK